ncbi:MAG TPA: tetratricopeptide repeat protein, partial [Phycisphaerales bacterium]|nr:tetratricopeptide repeat protein [Phycisphaerales bacterium]
FKDHNDDSMMLNQLAWMIVNAPDSAKHDYDLALKVASRANEVASGKDPAVLDTLAFCYFNKGQLEEAVKTEKAALALNPAQEELVDELKANLEKFENALKNKSGS